MWSLEESIDGAAQGLNCVWHVPILKGWEKGGEKEEPTKMKDERADNS